MSTPVIFTRPPRRARTRVQPETRRREPRWLLAVIVLSLLAHLLFVLSIVLMNRFLPPPKLKDRPLPSSTTLSIEPSPPPQPQAAVPPRHIFMPTDEDKEAPHKETLIESANDHRLTSQSQTARQPDTVMPDVTAKREHPANLKDSPLSPSKQPPHPAQNSAKSQPEKTQPSPLESPHETPHPEQSTQAAPPQPTTKPPPKLPPTKDQTHKPATQPQQYDPNGLPVLPALDVPTMAPASQRRPEDASPASSLPNVAQDAHGAIGTHGDNSPESMATELGKYKQRVYAAIGSYWYPDVDNHFQVMPIGVVHIQFTIQKDGTVGDVKILDGDTNDLQLLRTISQNAILKSAPFPPFTPGMEQQVGDSYTDDVSFSIYGQ